MQLESLLTDADNHSEELLCCGKLSIKFSENVCVSDNVSKNDTEFRINEDASNENFLRKSNL